MKNQFRHVCGLLLSLSVFSGCTLQSGTGSSSGRSGTFVVDPTNVLSQDIESKNLWGRNYYRLDPDHTCPEGTKAGYESTIEFTADKRILDAGDPCNPKQELLGKLSSLEASYDKLLVGHGEKLYQYSLDPTSESDVKVEAWCTRTLVPADGEVMPVDFRLYTSPEANEALLSWVMLTGGYATSILDNQAMIKSEGSGKRLYSVKGGGGVLEIDLKTDPAKYNLYPGRYRMSDGSQLDLFCRFSK